MVYPKQKAKLTQKELAWLEERRNTLVEFLQVVEQAVIEEPTT